ncbi:uncharacterized protein METZ01_LOCUS456773 [marine metagenome]|uniref:Uncharacterized protein n=1 Tax=marine metagenome TaxID=408172 RepID=A0A383A8M7_9ZZZZ
MFKAIKKYFHLVSMGRYSEFLMLFIPWDNFLVGTDANGVNCFFIRKDIALQHNIELQNPGSVFKCHKTRTEGTYTKVPLSQEEQFERIKNFDFIEV